MKWNASSRSSSSSMNTRQIDVGGTPVEVVFKKIKNNETTLAIVNPGEFFGEMALLDGGPRSAAAKSIEDAKALVISTQNFETLREKSPQVALRIMDVLVRTLSTRLRQANKNLEVISFWID